MKKILYYSDTPTAKPHNKKTQYLADLLKLYRNTLFEFTPSFTDDTLLAYFMNVVAGLNQNYRGAEINVYKSEFNGRIHYVFKEPSGEAAAQVILTSATRCIDCEEDL